MSRKALTNVGASVRERLLNRAQQRGESHQDLLTRYAIERFLFRLGESPHRDRYVLKGAMLFHLWTPDAGRQTRDIDVLGRGDVSPEGVTEAFRDVLAVDVEPDGMSYDPDGMAAGEIRATAEYRGVRVRIPAELHGARLHVQVDVGVGDVVEPPPVEVTYPSLLDLPQPRILTYPREAVVAEKVHALVVLGLANTRLKDYFDLWALARGFPFDGRILSDSLRATFARRDTVLPRGIPLPFDPKEAVTLARGTQWSAFANRAGLRAGDVPLLDEVVPLVATFVTPLFHDGFAGRWQPGGPWEATDG